MLAGYTDSFGGGSNDFWLVKTDANGDSLWSRTFGGSDQDDCWSVQQTADGGYVLAGTTASFGAGSRDCWLVKTNANGDSLWSRTFGGTNNEFCEAAQQTSDGGFVLAGYTNSFGAGSWDFWLVKTGPALDMDDHFTSLPTLISLSAYPNPFNSELTLTVIGFTRDVRISLHNLLGQEVEVIHEGALPGTKLHYSAPASLSSGLYFVRAADARHVRTAKVVFLK